MPVSAITSVSRLFGHVSPLARLPVPQSRTSISALFGAISPLVTRPLEARTTLPALFGTMSLKVKNFSDQWTAAGYPFPQMDGYQYRRGFGVQRTPMRSGKARQRRKFVDGRVYGSVSFELTSAQLYGFEANLSAFGYDWFTMPLVTGGNDTYEAQPHTVKVIGNPSYGDLYGENIKVTLQIEFDPKLSTSATVNMEDYPDAEADVAAPGFTGGTLTETVASVKITTGLGSSLKTIDLDSADITEPAFTSGSHESLNQETRVSAPALRAGSTLVQTVFPHNITAGTGTQRIDIENTGIISPAFLNGGLGQVGAQDGAQIWLPSTISGTLVRTDHYIRHDAGIERVDVESAGSSNPQFYGGLMGRVIHTDAASTTAPAFGGGSLAI